MIIIKEYSGHLIVHTVGKPDLTMNQLIEFDMFEKKLKNNGISYVKTEKTFRIPDAVFEFVHLKNYYLDEADFTAWKLIK